MPKPKFMPKAMGPKTSFNWEIGDVIIERLAQGESLRAITKRRHIRWPKRKA
jgi:hypothetical protein